MYAIKPISFINQEIQVEFDQHPLYSRTPIPPNRFFWKGEVWEIQEVIGEWKDFDRRGKTAHNMRPSNLLKAAKRGSRGVGRFYYRVMTGDERIFQIYFDRAAWDQESKQGKWFLYAEYSYVIPTTE